MPDLSLTRENAAQSQTEVELSVVIPCLNEAETIEICVEKALKAMREANISGEVVVADNGSTDGSYGLAEAKGARVLSVKSRGYGNALMAGIEASRGKFIIMGDADDSYDFKEIPKFVQKLREGFDLVMGCRMPAGGGRIMPGAMPFLHRWWGNPMFSSMVRIMFNTPINDVNCGLRGFTKEHYHRLDMHCTGMEFAVELVIKSSIFNAKISEVPITLYQDGRISHAPHLNTFRDGWRTLRFYMLYSPRWLYLVPGICLISLGLLFGTLGLFGAKFGGIELDVHTMLFSGLSIIVGYQSVIFSLMAKVFAIGAGLMPFDERIQSFFKWASLEKTLVVGAISFVIGFTLLGFAIHQWSQADFGHLDYSKTMRLVIPGVTFAAIGFQTMLSSFFISILRLKRK